MFSRGTLIAPQARRLFVWLIVEARRFSRSLLPSLGSSA